MYVNLKTASCVRAAFAGALFGVVFMSHAQSVDEITELKKKQLLAEMKKGTVEERPSAVVVIQQPKIKPAPVEPKLNVPDFGVVSIAGKNPASLTAVIFENGSRNVRISVGETTPSGWLVERITPSGVTFSHALPPKISKSRAAKLSSNDRIATKARAASDFIDTEIEYQQVTVGLGSNPTPRMPAPYANSAVPQMAAQAMQFQGVPAVIPISVLAK